ncbi:hypothetical protein AB1Y20_021059 [Prymnesium parvum]|uniref:TFIIS N-terminal domain-containing protein n=1 Tax=Prymnesium parvum TaxID=97485 RepID=A0AB34JK90_PRYPA
MALASDHENLQIACRQREDALKEAEKLKRQIHDAQKALRAVNERVSKHEETISTVLESLGKRTITIDSLHRTQVGITVNKLRKCSVAKIAGLSNKLIMAWKALAERGDRTGAKLGEVPSGSTTATTHSPSRGHGRGIESGRPRSNVLDSVHDEHGRVERRVADPDNPEDELALREKAEAERMWEAQMGASRLTSASSRLAAVASNLKARYEERQAEKRSKLIQQISVLPSPGNPKKRQLSAPSASRGKDPRRL